VAAAHLVCASNNPIAGTYEIVLPLDDDPVPSIRGVFDYRSGADRWTLDPIVGLTWVGTVIDSSGLEHTVTMDDLGNIGETDYSEADLLPQTGDTQCAVSSRSGQNLFTNGAFGGEMTGVPLQIRAADGSIQESNRCYVANTTNGDVTLLYRDLSVVHEDGDLLFLGVVPSRLRTPDLILGNIRQEKCVTDMSFMFKRQAAGTLAVRVFEDEDGGELLGTLNLSAADGHDYVFGRSAKGYRLAIQIDNANANEPWDISGFDFDIEFLAPDYS
jgi:hypothetical protein